MSQKAQGALGADLGVEQELEEQGWVVEILFSSLLRVFVGFRGVGGHTFASFATLTDCLCGAVPVCIAVCLALCLPAAHDRRPACVPVVCSSTGGGCPARLQSSACDAW